MKIIFFIVLALAALFIIQKLIQALLTGVAVLVGIAIVIVLLVLIVWAVWRYVH